MSECIHCGQAKENASAMCWVTSSHNHDFTPTASKEGRYYVEADQDQHEKQEFWVLDCDRSGESAMRCMCFTLSDANEIAAALNATDGVTVGEKNDNPE